jgi:glycosyltransferase involved in cell wall biosynthesis
VKKVLMVAHQFPPVGGSGVQRSAKFAKYLPLYGWEPVVLTRDKRKMVLRDESLLKELPEDIEIIRTPAYDLTVLPWIFNKVGKFIAWKILIPDGEVLWMKRTVRVCLDRIEAGDIDVLYTTSSPYSDHLFGLEVKNHYPDLFWVADFRDEWTNNPYLIDKPHRPSRMKKERVMEKEVLKRADVLVTNTPIMKENFVRLNPGLDLETRMHVIPNGFDTEDFEGLRQKKIKNSQFTITYTGALYGRRKPDLVLEAVGNLVRKEKINKDNFLIRFIGSFKHEVLRNIIKRNGLEGSVETISYMEHDECLKNMVASDAMLLIEGGRPGSEAFYTGKIFEYIQTGNPILAVIPENGAAAMLIRETRTGIICDWSDIEAIERGFLDMYRSWEKNERIIDPNHEEIARYDRKALTRSLAELFNKSLN